MLDEMHDDSRSLPLHLFVGKTPEIIQAADCCLMVSGSVSLEMLGRGTPAVVVYNCSWLFSLFVKLLVQCKYASLPNLIADREILPEFFRMGDAAGEVKAITAKLSSWLEDRRALDGAKAELQQLLTKLGRTGATARTAEAILRRIEPTALDRAA